MTKSLITLHVSLRDPCLMAGYGGDPNIILSLPYLTGSAIRGALLREYRQQNGLKNGLDDSASGKAGRQLFLAGGNRFLNGYPSVGEQRAFPTPSSFYQSGKWHPEDSDGIIDCAAEDDDDEDEVDFDGHVQVKSDFASLEYGSVIFHNSELELHFHNHRDPRLGRATEASGDVFRFRALSKGQKFVFHIICDDLDDANTILALAKAKQQLKLGGSRTAGYGTVDLTKIELSSAASWDFECGNKDDDEPRLSSGASQCVLTLTSDTIIRDNAGRLTPNHDGLIHYLNWKLFNSTESPNRVDSFNRITRVDSWTNQATIGGFNGKAKLPLTTEYGLAMGSVFILGFEKPLDDNAVKEITSLQWQGLGTRRKEGFGRFAINAHGNMRTLYVTSPDDVAVPRPSGNAPKAFLDLHQRVLLQRLETATDRIVRTPTPKIDLDQIQAAYRTKTQLNSLRNHLAGRLHSSVKTKAELMEILTIPDPKTGRASAWWNEFLVRFFEDQSFDAWVTMHKSPIASVSREELRRNFFAECADDDKSLGEFVERIEVRFLELLLGKTLRSIINSQSNPESTVGA